MKAIAIVGPTASGKTALALSLAKIVGGEILCCDSMQIYRGMDIGTAKPTAQERTMCRHHLFDIAEPTEPFSASDYATHALATMRDITSRGVIPIFCGGTGLYLDAVRTMRHQKGTPPPDLTIRQELNEIAQTQEGREALYKRLTEIDPQAAAATHPNNARRVVRALEIYTLTGRTKTELDQESAANNPDVELLTVGLCFNDRALLCQRIDLRVDQMLADGLLKETQRLAATGLFQTNTTAAQAIGYKELLPYLEGSLSLEAAVSQLKIATHRYAKRQMTYFRAMPSVHWVCADHNGQIRTTEDLLTEIVPLTNTFFS